LATTHLLSRLQTWKNAANRAVNNSVDTAVAAVVVAMAAVIVVKVADLAQNHVVQAGREPNLIRSISIF